MNNELLLLIKNRLDTLIEQTKSRAQEALEFKLSKQKQVFSFNPSINPSEEGRRLLAVTSFEATNSVFFLELTKTIRFQSLQKVIGNLNLLKQLLVNYISY